MLDIVQGGVALLDRAVPSLRAAETRAAGSKFTALWGIAPAGPAHFGLDSILATLRKLDVRGWQLTILSADLHLTLSHGLQLDNAIQRAAYYRAYLADCCGLRARFVNGSDLQTRSDYLLAMLEACRAVSLNKAKASLPSRSRSDSGVSATVASVLYPVMQCVDVLALAPRAIVADQGQIKIYSLLGSAMSGERRRGGASPRMLVVPTGVDIRGMPLNESTRDTRIHLEDTRESLARKVKAMYAPPANQAPVPGRANALLWYFRYSVFPWITMPLRVKARGTAEYVYRDAASFEHAYLSSTIHPLDAKEALERELWKRIAQAKERIAPELRSWIRK